MTGLSKADEGTYRSFETTRGTAANEPVVDTMLGIDVLLKDNKIREE